MFAGPIGFLLFLALVLLQLGLVVAWSVAFTRGWWRTVRALGRPAPYIIGPKLGGTLRFDGDVFALREAGRIEDAAALATGWIQDENVPMESRNTAIDILISAGAYEAALNAERRASHRTGVMDARGLALIQINLAEADYNLGRWDDAKRRLDPLDAECSRHRITRAGLLVQRAWIAAHQGRATEALELCAAVKPRWFPASYRAEYYFAQAAALLAADRLDAAEAAVADGARAARRISSERNALFLGARVAAVRGDWAGVERLCRLAAEHSFRGQGGEGLLLWARALRELGRGSDATEALRLVVQRDPESESAATAAALLSESRPGDTLGRAGGL
jgi:tetratricopeptide (TPR) repeat protein